MHIIYIGDLDGFAVLKAFLGAGFNLPVVAETLVLMTP